MSLTSALEPNSSSAKHQILDKSAAQSQKNSNNRNKSANKAAVKSSSNSNSSRVVLNSHNANQLNGGAAAVTNGEFESKRGEDLIKNGTLMSSVALNGGKSHVVAAAKNGLSNGKANGSLSNGKLHPAPGASLDEQFKAACDAINNLPKNGPVQPSNEMLLKFYGYFKQATQGPCQTSRPSMFKVIERAKYDAWHSVRNLSKEEAMRGYIDEIKSIIEIMPHTENVQKFIELVGPFYEYVNDENEPPSSAEAAATTLMSKKDLEDEDDENDDEDGGGDQHTQAEEANDSLRSDSTMVASFEQQNGSALSLTNSFNGGGEYEKINPSMLNSYASLNGSYSEYLIGQNGGVDHHHNHSNGVSNGIVNGGSKASNGHAVTTNGASNSVNTNDDDEDDEDYCDTSDILNEQESLLQTAKLNSAELSALVKPIPIRSTLEVNNQNGKSFVKPLIKNGPSPTANYDLNHNVLPSVLKAFSGSSNNNDHSNGPVFYNNSSLNGQNHHSNHHHHHQHYENSYRLSASHNDAELEAILNKLGGELMNSPPALSGGSMARNSRPSSTQSVVYGGRNLPSGSGFNQSGSGGGGAGGSSGGGNGGGGGHPTLDLLHHHDTNRQILLILIKLQQDTNNVLRRLSYLESTVVTIQNHLHMNRLETNFEMNNQGSSAFSLLSTNPGRGVDNVYTSPNQLNTNNHRRSSMWRHFFRNIDWRTVSIAIIWPLVIRLVFMFFRKVRLVIKLRRVRP